MKTREEFKKHMLAWIRNENTDFIDLFNEVYDYLMAPLSDEAVTDEEIVLKAVEQSPRHYDQQCWIDACLWLRSRLNQAQPNVPEAKVGK